MEVVGSPLGTLVAEILSLVVTSQQPLAFVAVVVVGAIAHLVEVDVFGTVASVVAAFPVVAVVPAVDVGVEVLSSCFFFLLPPEKIN